jgi:uracil-DNA glycosylase
MVLLNNSWDEILKEDFESASYRDLREFLKTEYFNHTVYPAMNDIYNALNLTP